MHNFCVWLQQTAKYEQTSNVFRPKGGTAAAVEAVGQRDVIRRVTHSPFWHISAFSKREHQSFSASEYIITQVIRSKEILSSSARHIIVGYADSRRLPAASIDPP